MGVLLDKILEKLGDDFTDENELELLKIDSI